jgi:hypothetical protein
MFWTIVFAIITAFFGIVLISVSTRFLVELWEEYRGALIVVYLMVPAAFLVWAEIVFMR